MPELPEVETVRRSLHARTSGARIAWVEAPFAKCIEAMTPDEFLSVVRDRQIMRWGRIGKYLTTALDDGAFLTVHLRMTGRLVVVDEEIRQTGAHTRLMIGLADGRILRFDDQRKFGRIAWYPDQDSLEEALPLGPEPIDERFGPEDFHALLASRTRPIKSLLLDQRIVAGVGNIYADEALFYAKLAPNRPAQGLQPQESRKLWLALRDVLLRGIAHRGTSMRDYVDADGRTGEFQNHLMVYGREGEPCLRCGNRVQRIKISGRSTFHCPVCQR